jgi:HD domain-containing protein
MLEGVPGMEATRRAILEHHEHFDGSGYPYGLRGEDISVTARILSVAESYDSAISARPHRSAISPEEALQMVRGGHPVRPRGGAPFHGDGSFPLTATPGFIARHRAPEASGQAPPNAKPTAHPEQAINFLHGPSVFSQQGSKINYLIISVVYKTIK